MEFLPQYSVCCWKEMGFHSHDQSNWGNWALTTILFLWGRGQLPPDKLALTVFPWDEYGPKLSFTDTSIMTKFVFFFLQCVVRISLLDGWTSENPLSCFYICPGQYSTGFFFWLQQEGSDLWIAWFCSMDQCLSAYCQMHRWVRLLPGPSAYGVRSYDTHKSILSMDRCLFYLKWNILHPHKLMSLIMLSFLLWVFSHCYDKKQVLHRNRR